MSPSLDHDARLAVALAGLEARGTSFEQILNALSDCAKAVEQQDSCTTRRSNSLDWSIDANSSKVEFHWGNPPFYASADFMERHSKQLSDAYQDACNKALQRTIQTIFPNAVKVPIVGKVDFSAKTAMPLEAQSIRWFYDKVLACAKEEWANGPAKLSPVWVRVGNNGDWMDLEAEMNKDRTSVEYFWAILLSAAIIGSITYVFLRARRRDEGKGTSSNGNATSRSTSSSALCHFCVGWYAGRIDPAMLDGARDRLLSREVLEAFDTLYASRLITDDAFRTARVAAAPTAGEKEMYAVVVQDVGSRLTPHGNKWSAHHRNELTSLLEQGTPPKIEALRLTQTTFDALLGLS